MRKGLYHSSPFALIDQGLSPCFRLAPLRRKMSLEYASLTLEPQIGDFFA